MLSARLAELLDEWTEDTDGNGTGAEDLRRDPEAWARAVTEWGLRLRAVRPDMRAAQQDAERLRALVVAAGLADQAEAPAAAADATSRSGLLRQPTVAGWQGTLDLEFADTGAFRALLQQPR